MQQNGKVTNKSLDLGISKLDRKLRLCVLIEYIGSLLMETILKIWVNASTDANKVE
mgnify:CR=1 FL=1